MIDFYTVIFRKSSHYWVALCLENGIVGQGLTKDEALERLQEAIQSFEEVYQSEDDVYSAPISIKELHEFLTIEETQPSTQGYELRAVYA